MFVRHFTSGVVRSLETLRRKAAPTRAKPFANNLFELHSLEKRILLTVAAPSNLVVLAKSGTQIAMTWTDNSTDESGFRIERSVSGGAFSFLADVAANVPRFVDTHLQPRTDYNYRVSAFKNGPPSDISTPSGQQADSTFSPLSRTSYPFDDGDFDGWSNHSTQRINDDPATSGSDPTDAIKGPTTLSLSNLPEHVSVTVGFTLFVMDRYDDTFSMSIGGVPAISTDFANRWYLGNSTWTEYKQSYPDATGGRADAQYYASEVWDMNDDGLNGQAGFTCGPDIGDAKYVFSVTVPHKDSTISLNFSGASSSEKSFAIDNVALYFQEKGCDCEADTDTGAARAGPDDNELASDGFDGDFNPDFSITYGGPELVDGGNGNHTSSQVPSLQEIAADTNAGTLTLGVVQGSNVTMFDGSSGSLTERDGGIETLTYDQTNGDYVLTEDSGRVLIFNDFDTARNIKERGRLKQILDPYGNTTDFFYNATTHDLDHVDRSHDDGVNVVKESYQYAYLASPDVNAGKIKSVTLQRKRWASGTSEPGSYTRVRTVEYSYYDNSLAGAQAFGRLGDLRTTSTLDPSAEKTGGSVTSTVYNSGTNATTVTVSLTNNGYAVGDTVVISGASTYAFNGTFVVTSAATNTFSYVVNGSISGTPTMTVNRAIKVNYWRYYTADGSTGYAGALKYAVTPDGYARLAKNTGNALTATDAQVAVVADEYYEYDASHRVVRQAAADETGTHLYSYSTSAHGTGRNTWRDKTTETLADGSEKPVTTLARVATTATATVTGHGYAVGDLVLISGASPAVYNGVFAIVTVPTVDTFTYTMASDPGASGSGTMKVQKVVQRITYFNGFGQTMLEVDRTTGTGYWGTFYTYDPDGRVVMKANPSALALPTDLATLEPYGDLLNAQYGDYQYLRDNAGLVELTGYYDGDTAGSQGGTPGGAEGYEQAQLLRRGEPGIRTKTGGTITSTSYSAGTNTTTVTVSLASHGYVVGDRMVIRDASPAAYNGAFDVASVPGSGSFTYVVAGNPGASSSSVRTEKVVKSVVWVSGSTYRATFSGHGYTVGDTILLTGADQPEYDGTFVVEATTTDTIDFTINAAPNGNAKGIVRVDEPVLLSRTDYWVQTAGGATVFVPAISYEYSGAGGTGVQKTRYDYTWYSGTTQMQSRTTTLPPVTTGNNGRASGADDTANADSSVEYFDLYGRTTWEKDADGFITYTQYDDGTGAVRKVIRDVNTANTADFTGLPAGWTSSGGLHLITQFDVDELGRTIKQTDPDPDGAGPLTGNITYTVYNDATREVRTYRGWNTSTNLPTGPTEVVRDDRGNKYVEHLTMSAAPSITSGKPDGKEAISGVLSISRTFVNDLGQTIYSDRYESLPNGYSVTPPGNPAADGAYRTQYAYDDRGRLIREQDALGEITRTVYDALGRVISTWIGTDDTPTTGVWSPGNTAGTDLAKVGENQYDEGGVGDGNVTKTILHPTGAASGTLDRETRIYYDWRDRLVASKEGIQTSESGSLSTQRPIHFQDLDNLGRTIATYQYDGDNVTVGGGAAGGDANGDGVPDQPSSSVLRAKTGFTYDEDGRLAESRLYSVNQGNGSISANSLCTDTWYDKRGNVIKTSEPGGMVHKYAYDGAGRQTKAYTTDGGASTASPDASWSEAGNVNGDAVLEQVETQYDVNDNVILTTTRERNHDENTTGALGDAGTTPKARVSYVAYFYDKANRLTDSVDAGTNGGVAYTWPKQAPGRTTITGTGSASAGGSTSTIDLGSVRNEPDGYFIGYVLRITSGVDSGKNAIVTAYNSSTHVATFSPSFSNAPGTSAGYTLEPTAKVTNYGYAADEVQTITLTGATGGTFTVNYNGGTFSAAVAYNATAATLQSALEATAVGIGTGNVRVIGPVVTSTNTTYYVRFYGAKAEQNVASLGVNGSSLTGASPTISARTTSEGGDAGQMQKAIDPKGILTKTDYDMLGRTLRTTEAFFNFTPDPTDDRITDYSYDGNDHVLTMRALLPSNAFQTTQYVYGVTAAGGNDLTSNNLLAEVRYPTKTGTSAGQPGTANSDKVRYTYDALGERKTMTDQNGTVHQYSYDVVGRFTQDYASTLGTGVDGTVNKIIVTYATGGQVFRIDSQGPSSSIVSVDYTYNGLGFQSTQEYDTQLTGVNGTITYNYDFNAASGTPNRSRLTSISYPGGRVVTYDYGTTGSLNDVISRVGGIKDSSVFVEEYSYLGLDAIVRRYRQQAGTEMTYIKQGTDAALTDRAVDPGDQYTGLDRFGRVVDQRWRKISSSAEIDRFGYTYDLGDNRTSRAVLGVNHPATATTGLDEAYTYDSLNRLSKANRGLLSGGTIADASSDWQQTWTLDALGNWSSFATDADGGLGGGAAATQNRTHDSRNELTAGAGTFSPTYDANGNMTTDERGWTYEYDAWNHLMRVKNAGTTQVSYLYDGLARRISRILPGQTTDYYYTNQWQLAEERIAGVTQNTYVWGLGYPDALIERNNSSGIRHYAQQDANWNVTSLTNSSGGVLERYRYDPYGAFTVLNGTSGVDADGAVTEWSTDTGGSDQAWLYLHQGGRYDATSKLYSFRHREYSPSLGRWTSRDPLGYVDGPNQYQALHSSPITLRDPSGTTSSSDLTINDFQGPPDKEFPARTLYDFKENLGAPALTCEPFNGTRDYKVTISYPSYSTWPEFSKKHSPFVMPPGWTPPAGIQKMNFPEMTKASSGPIFTDLARLLRHETYHLRMAEAAAGPISQKVQRLVVGKSVNRDPIKAARDAQIDWYMRKESLTNKEFGKLHSKQLEYDDQTRHGLDPEMQAYWESWIDEGGAEEWFSM